MKYCVYFLIKNGIVIYIGMTCNIQKRLADHGKNKFDTYRSIACRNKGEAFMYEQRLIRYFKPILNAAPRDQKDTASFKLRPELRKALKREAEKDKRTLSWYLESIIENFAKRNKLETK